MMRSIIKRSIVTIVVAVGVLGLSSAATALTVDLLWAGSGTNVTGTAFAGSEVVTLDVYATFALPPGLSGVAVSISWDTNALSLVSCDVTNKQTVAGGSFLPLLGSRSACLAASPGLQPAMDQQAGWLPYLGTGGTLDIGSLVFHVIGAGGNTVVSSFFNPAGDGWLDNAYAFSLNATLNDATVHVIPEPTTAILVGLGFMGLLAAGRRRRS
jgi:hypothetical protein